MELRACYRFDPRGISHFEGPILPKRIQCVAFLSPNCNRVCGCNKSVGNKKKLLNALTFQKIRIKNFTRRKLMKSSNNSLRNFWLVLLFKSLTIFVREKHFRQKSKANCNAKESERKVWGENAPSRPVLRKAW